MNTQAPRHLTDLFDEFASGLDPGEGHAAGVRRITSMAHATIDGCAAASMTVLTADGEVRTEGATGALAVDGDQIQYEEREGPCLDAAMTERWVRSDDLESTTRWPRSARRLVDELQVRSMLSCRLAPTSAPSSTLGGLNLYSMKPFGFTDDDVLLAVVLGSLGSLVLRAAQEQGDLRKALESRQVIGEAIGILRAQSNVTSDEAFGMLAKASQRMNIKLRDVAADLTAQFGAR
jgi:hypothetical protein